MNESTVRPAEDDELNAVAGLRWRWVLENEGTPATTREEFVDHFVTWARKNVSTHRCVVLLREDAFAQAQEWATRVERGLVRITSLRSSLELRGRPHQPCPPARRFLQFRAKL